MHLYVDNYQPIVHSRGGGGEDRQCSNISGLGEGEDLSWNPYAPAILPRLATQFINL